MLDGKSIDKILREARTHNGFQNKPVTDAQIRELYEMLRWGPTSSNSQPARFVFVRTKEGKEKLRPALSSGNTAKTMEAPVTAIVAYDTQFHEHLPRIFPHNPTAQRWFTGPGNEQERLALLEAHRADVQARLAEIQESLKIIDHKIDVYRGSLAAGDADRLWAPVSTA